MLLGFWSLFLSPHHIQRAAVILKPTTLFKFHDILKKRKYRLLYTARRKGKQGPKSPSQELIEAIVEMKRRNSRFGCPRIRTHWVLVVMDQFTRRIIGFGVHAGDVDGVALCRMFNIAISSKAVLKYLSSDNDPLFLYHQWQANLRILRVDEIKTVPYTPLSHPFIARLK
jgi:transposase InsO family protein